MFRKSFLCVILVSLSSSLFSAEQIVATVNGKKILKSHLETTYMQAKLSNAKHVPTKEQILNELINRELGIQRAKQTKIGYNKVVAEKLNDVLFHAQISDDLAKEFQKIRVKDKEVKEYYSKNPEYSSSHILFRMKVNPSKEERDRMLKSTLKIYEQISREPKRFGEFAQRFSQAVNAQQKGLMGYLPAIHLPKEYYNAIKGKSEGEIIPPIRTQFGYHIVQVHGVKKYKDINMNLYKKIIYDQKRDAIIAKYFKKLRSKAKIKVNRKLIK